MDLTLMFPALRKRSHTDTGAVCRYDITATYKCATNSHVGLQLQQATVFARLLVAGQTFKVVDQTKSVASESCIQWKLGGFFSTPPGCTFFAIYVGFKDYQDQQSIIWEGKFYQQFPHSDHTWDIVSNKSLHGEFSLSLETHHLDPDLQTRIDMLYESELGATSNHLGPFISISNSGRGGMPLEREIQFIQNLLDSPLSEERTNALLFNVSHLTQHYSDPEGIHYVDLSIQALSAAYDYAQDHPLLDFPRMEFFRMIFHRCTRPDGGSFADKAFSALKTFDMSIAQNDEELIDLLVDVLLVLKQQGRAEYATVAFQVLTPTFCVLAKKYPASNRRLFGLITLAAGHSFTLVQNMKETLTILEIALPFISSCAPQFFGSTLVRRAVVYIQQSEERGDPDFASVESVLAAVEQAQAHVLKHGKIDEGDLYHHFLVSAIEFLTSGSHTPRENMFHLSRVYTFFNWAFPALELEPSSDSGTLSILRQEKEHAMDVIFLDILSVMRLPFEIPDLDKDRFVEEIIRAIYCEQFALESQDVEIIRSHFMHLIRTNVPCSGCTSTLRGAALRMNAIIEFSISTEPYDRITLLRVMFAAVIARDLGLPAALKAYQLFMASADLWDSPFTPNEDQLFSAGSYTPITSDAITYALESGHHDLALEWADQSCAMTWGRVLDFRASMTRIAEFKPQLAERLAEATSRSKANIDYAKLRAEGRIVCTPDWQNTLEDVRKLPGLGRFLKPKLSPQIQSMAEALGGPVIYLNTNRHSCDALVILPGLDETLHIPLPAINLHELVELGDLFYQSLKGTGREEIQLGRLGKLVKNPNGSIPQHLYVSFPTVLEYLWDRVVKPVLNGLGIQRSESGSADDLPRIWWCPSGPLAILPLHAAGHYRNPTDDNIMDYVVSSYIPSASVTSQITRAEDTTPSFRLLAVANPAGCRLPGTQQDLHAIRKYVVNGPLTELVEESATPEAVKDELKSATWVHFACHGVQNRLLPTENSLILANHARLTLLDIIQLSLPKAQFAFLSACQTATGTLLGTDESAHLTAGMLLAGYRSVVGSMWNISDDYAPYFADRFYGRMFDGTQRPDYRRSAFALHDAVKMLRRDMNLGFRVWVPFIHVGA